MLNPPNILYYSKNYQKFTVVLFLPYFHSCKFSWPGSKVSQSVQTSFHKYKHIQTHQVTFLHTNLVQASVSLALNTSNPEPTKIIPKHQATNKIHQAIVHSFKLMFRFRVFRPKNRFLLRKFSLLGPKSRVVHKLIS